MKKNKVIVVLGTTASGKTKLAVDLARRFNGEIISADSRQVYKGMDVGTGKDLGEYNVKIQNLKGKSASQKSKVFKIPHHLIDVADPKKQYTVAQWQQAAYEIIDDILRRGKVPIVCGGTGLYVSALVEGYVFGEAKKHKNTKTRARLNKLTLTKLLILLKKIDPATFNIIDRNNRRRVQRALEIYYETGRPKSAQVKKVKPPYKFLLLGLTFPKTVLQKRITKRLVQRLEKEGMVNEVRRLHRQGVSWKRLEEFGLEYRYIARYLQKKISYDELVEQLSQAIIDFAKRQLTWFKRDKKIIWLKNKIQALAKAKKFID